MEIIGKTRIGEDILRRPVIVGLKPGETVELWPHLFPLINSSGEAVDVLEYSVGGRFWRHVFRTADGVEYAPSFV